MGLLLCSCATENVIQPVHPQLPPTVSMNEDAGRGGLLLVEVRLADGEKLPFVIDTGAAMTMFDKSLESKLGERLGTTTLTDFGVKQEGNTYVMPKLYLGHALLQTPLTNTVTFDRQKLADGGHGPALMGIIGMDVLQNYCIQLDFVAGKVRFLDDEHADKTNWGTAFPLTVIGNNLCIYENLVGVKGLASTIDTGCNGRGWLRPELYRQWTNQEQSAHDVYHELYQQWRNQAPSHVKVHSPDGTLGGEKYHDLDLYPMDAKLNIARVDGFQLNGIGMRALAQNLVTLDFPNRTLYLKHISDWPLPSKDDEAVWKSAAYSSIKTFRYLLLMNQLPGMPKGDRGTTTGFDFNHDSSPYLDSGTWAAIKNGDSLSIYHYAFTRTSKHGAWKLKRAWRTDQDGHLKEEYPLP